MSKSEKQPLAVPAEEKRTKELESTLSSIDLATLKTCLKIYNKLKSDGPRYLNEFEDELGIDNATIHRRVTRLEEAMASLLGVEKPSTTLDKPVRFRLFERQRGSKAKIPSDDWLRQEVESIFFNIGEIIAAWERLAHRWGAGEVVVRLATTLSAARFILPNLLRVPELKEVWFDVTQTKSSRLLELAEAKSRDLIVTDVPRHIGDSPNRTVFQFKLALILPRGHFLEHNRIADWTLGQILRELADRGTSLCLLPEDPSLYPLPDYPDSSLFPSNLRVLRAGSTTLCQSLVMSSRLDSPIVAITGTQFLTEDDLERLVIIELPEQKPSHMALIRPNKDEGSNISRTAATAVAEDAIRKMLEEASKSTVNQASDRFSIYHTTRMHENNVWAKGELLLRSRAPTSDSSNQSRIRVLTGSHTMQGMQEGLSYVVRGRAVQNEGNSHVTYRARAVGGQVEDSYVFSGFCPSFRDMKAGPIVGIWNGVFSSADTLKGQKEFTAGAGFVVITDEHDVDIRFLNRLANEYKAKYESACNIIFFAEQLQESVARNDAQKLAASRPNKAEKRKRPRRS